MRVAVIGASGFVGRALVARLAAAGHEVRAVSRRATHVPSWGSAVTAVAADAGDGERVAAALDGVEVAYYLVHSMRGAGFRARDREVAAAFAAAARDAGVGRIVYLGALGADPGSEHLASRQEVGEVLASTGVDVVELRAAVVLGAGSISFEMLRYLTERLPFMVCPRWVHTRIQPVAERDLLEYLERAVSVPPGTYEIGGADVTTYREMIARYAQVRGLHRRVIVDVPYLTPRLSSYWVDLVTPVDRSVSHALIESLVTEVIVHDQARTDDAFGLTPVGLDAALADALDAQAAAIGETLGERASGLEDGVYTERVEVEVPAGAAAGVDDDFDAIGGSLEWYGVAGLWRVRLLLGRLFGERLRAAPAPGPVVPGVAVDWWTVLARRRGSLVLRSAGWHPGEAWLGWFLVDGRLVQVGALRPRGVAGFIYWKQLAPMHRRVFRTMVQARVRRAMPPTATVPVPRSA